MPKKADAAVCCVGFLYGSLYNMQGLFHNLQKEKTRKKIKMLQQIFLWRY